MVNAHGRKMRVLKRVRPLPGRDVILTIDLDAQLAASNALAGRRGAVVAIDPDTGEVLAFTSTPGYDPNAISAGLSRRAYLALQEDIDRPTVQPCAARPVPARLDDQADRRHSRACISV